MSYKYTPLLRYVALASLLRYVVYTTPIKRKNKMSKLTTKKKISFALAIILYLFLMFLSHVFIFDGKLLYTFAFFIGMNLFITWILVIFLTPIDPYEL